jgi:predicted kinase
MPPDGDSARAGSAARAPSSEEEPTVEAVILCGIQAAGKTSFYRDRYLDTHVRISLDLHRTRHREALFLETCLRSGQRFVVDNTNPTADERRRYTVPALAAGFRLVACLVDVSADEALARNARRPAAQRIPVAGLLGTRKRLEPPAVAEGFDEVWLVRHGPAGGWRLERSTA